MFTTPVIPHVKSVGYVSVLEVDFDMKLSIGVRRRKNGLLEKRFTVEGKRYSVYGYTIEELVDNERDKRVKLSGKFISVDEYFEMWIKGKVLTVKESTIRLYESNYRLYISPLIGDMRINRVNRRDIINIQYECSKNINSCTNNGMLRVAKVLFNDAIIDGYIDVSPCRGVRSIKEGDKANETYHRALTIEEQKLFFEYCKNDYYYELFVLMIRTGMRLGEAGALYWSDIDYELNVIHVRRTITRDKKGVFVIGESTKSEAGNRDIPMNEGIREILTRQKEKNTGKLVFISKRGYMISHSTVNREIRNVCISTGIDVITSHAFRDTFATRFIEQGGNPQTLKVILGHSSLSLTMDLYSHVLPNTKQEEMDRVVIEL